jgi:hypothetical protein
MLQSATTTYLVRLGILALPVAGVLTLVGLIGRYNTPNPRVAPKVAAEAASSTGYVVSQFVGNVLGLTLLIFGVIALTVYLAKTPGKRAALAAMILSIAGIAPIMSAMGVPNATALALGYFTTCAAMGVAGLTFFGGAESAASTTGRVLSVMVGGLLLVLGIRSLLNAPDPDAQPPRWMESVSAMSPPKAFGFGMALFPIQIKDLAIFVTCVNLIAAASLGPGGSAVALGIVLLIFAIPVLALIGLYATMPRRASEMLGSLRVWMEKNGRAITVELGFVFGAFFLVKGLLGA